jgi:hydrogenase nickel incorporation protein HypA/HybF
VHEASLARQVLEVALERAAAEGTRRVLAVHGWVSETEALAPQSLALHFAAHARGTLAEGARLEIRVVRVEARCGSCGGVYAPEHHDLLFCPSCGSGDAELLGQVGLGIDRLEVE